MSARYEALVTLTVRGEEQDVFVRAHVERELFGRGWQAAIDGDIEANVDGKWTDLDALGVDAKEAARAGDELCDAALEDDSDQCVESEDYDDEA
jgi:hypothetical protein